MHSLKEARIVPIIVTPQFLLIELLSRFGAAAVPADPIACPVEEPLSLKPSFTLVGGRVVYGADGRLSQES